MQQRDHVLIIDDDDGLRSVIRDLLVDEGYRVSTEAFRHSSIDEVSARIANDLPDAFVLDVMIGGRPIGWEVLETVRAMPATVDLPVLICTALRPDDDAISDRLTRLDAELISKPFDIDEFCAALVIAMDASDDRADEIA